MWDFLAEYLPGISPSLPVSELMGMHLPDEILDHPQLHHFLSVSNRAYTQCDPTVIREYTLILLILLSSQSTPYHMRVSMVTTINNLAGLHEWIKAFAQDDICTGLLSWFHLILRHAGGILCDDLLLVVCWCYGRLISKIPLYMARSIVQYHFLDHIEMFLENMLPQPSICPSDQGYHIITTPLQLQLFIRLLFCVKAYSKYCEEWVNATTTSASKGKDNDDTILGMVDMVNLHIRIFDMISSYLERFRLIRLPLSSPPSSTSPPSSPPVQSSHTSDEHQSCDRVPASEVISFTVDTTPLSARDAPLPLPGDDFYRFIFWIIDGFFQKAIEERTWGGLGVDGGDTHPEPPCTASVSASAPPDGTSTATGVERCDDPMIDKIHPTKIQDSNNHGNTHSNANTHTNANNNNNNHHHHLYDNTQHRGHRQPPIYSSLLSAGFLEDFLRFINDPQCSWVKDHVRMLSDVINLFINGRWMLDSGCCASSRIILYDP